MTTIKTNLGTQESARRQRFESTGTIVATDVQEAIEELATDAVDDVDAASTFANDNRVIRSDGTGRGVQASGVELTDSDVLRPATSDAAVLGDTTHMWSNVFLASGAVINWNNGDATLTHSANTLTFAAASSGYNFDAKLIRNLDNNGSSGGGIVLEMPSTWEVSTDRYTINSTEGNFTVPFTYSDKTLQIGYNWTGSARSNTSVPALYLQWEHRYQLNNDPAPAMKVTEWHLNAMSVGGVNVRPISVVAAWDGGFGNVAFQSDTTVWSDWDNVQIASLTSALFDLQGPSVAIHTDTATSFSITNAANSSNILVVNTGGSTLSTSLNVEKNVQNLIVAKNANPVGTASLQVQGANGGKIGSFTVDSSGNLQISNANVGGATFMDFPSGGAIWRNASFATVMTLTNAGVLSVGASTAIELDGDAGFGTTAPDRRLHSEVDDATTNAVTHALRLTHTTSGTPANGIGVGMEFEVETSAANNEVGAIIQAAAASVTAAAENVDLEFYVMSGGAAAARVAYFGSTPNSTTGRGMLVLENPSADASGFGIRFTSNAGAATGSFTMDNSGAMVFRQSSGTTMFFDCQSNGITWRDSSFATIMKMSTTGSLAVGHATPDRRLHSEVSDTATATVTHALRLTHVSTNTVAANFAVGMEAELENAAGTNRVVGTLEWSYTDATDATEDADLLVKLMAAGATAAEVARFKSTGGMIAAGQITSSSASAGVGYSTGAGGTVTQATDKSTAVTLDKVTGQITMNNAALAASTSVGFTLNNSTIATTDVVVVCVDSGATANSYLVGVDAVGAGSCHIHLRNTSAGSLGEAVVLNFVVLKGVTS